MKSLDEPSDDLADRLLDDFQGHPDPGIVVDTLAERKHWDGPTATLNIVDQTYVRTLLEQAGPTLRWLAGFGVGFAALPTSFPTTSTTRLMPVGGGLALVEALTRAATAKRRHLPLRDHRARPRGRGRGGDRGAGRRPARTADRDGQVILACGGYEGNSELLARYHGEKGMVCRPVARGGHYNKGEGIEMALRAGAATAGNFALFHAEPIDPRSGQPEAAIFSFSYGILVNADGGRFVDEAPGPADAWYERITRVIQAQPRGLGYLILDADTAQLPNVRASIRTDQRPITGRDLDELAAALDMPAGVLRETVAAYNSACRPGVFDRPAWTAWPPRASPRPSRIGPGRSPARSTPTRSWPPTSSPSAACVPTRPPACSTATAGPIPGLFAAGS